jgi:hypothetical protein
VPDDLKLLLTFAMAAVSLLWRLLSVQKSNQWERMIYILVAYAVAYATGMTLLRRLIESMT